MNQARLSVAIGVSDSSIGLWENGRNITQESLDKLINYARERGLSDIAMRIEEEFRGPQRVIKVFEPGTREPIILPAKSGTRDLRHTLHEAVDGVLNSGDPEAMALMEAMLLFLCRTVQK